MASLLINSNDLYKYNMNNLLKKTNCKKDSKNILCIILILPKSEFEYINTLEKGDTTITYMNSEKFINKILKIYKTFYSTKRNVCEIRENISNHQYLKEIVHSIRVYLPENTIIWCGLIDIENYNTYIQEGFSHPYSCNKSPLGFEFNETGIAFIQKNVYESQLTHSSIKNKLEYLKLTDKDIKNKCMIYIRFKPETVDYLKGMINKKYEKELSGCLLVSSIIKKDKEFIFELSSNPKSVILGVDEEVDAVWGRYNFHTHPEKAYKNHNVKNGWPSGQDFVGFLQLKNHTIFHTVVTLEGLYIISLCEKWNKNINKINKKYILKNYGIDHSHDITPFEYVKIINSMEYKGKQLFDIKYLEWNKATSIIPIFFEKTEGSCIITDDIFNISDRE